MKQRSEEKFDELYFDHLLNLYSSFLFIFQLQGEEM